MGFAARLGTALDQLRPQLPEHVAFAAWDLREREPVLLDAERPLQPASTIKTLIMVAALRRVRDGALTLDHPVDLPAHRVGGSGVLREIPSASRLALGDLINLMIVVSDNAATNAVLDTLGFDAVAACARELGAESTRVERHLMDHSATGTNTTTALDQARVLDALATGFALPEALSRRALNTLARQQVRDRVPAALGRGADVWNKTGELHGLRHDTALVGRGEPEAVLAVLVDGLTDERSTSDYRGGPGADAITTLARAVWDALEGDEPLTDPPAASGRTRPPR